LKLIEKDRPISSNKWETTYAMMTLLIK
jgi:alpha-galactosidase